MSIAFNCPQCHHRYEVPESVAGKSTKCSKCGKQLKVPAQHDGLVFEDEPRPPQASQDRDEQLLFESDMVEVSNARIQYGSATIPLDGVLSVRIENIKKTRPSKNNVDVRWMCLLFFGLAFLVFAGLRNDSGTREAGAIVFLAVFIIAGLLTARYGKYQKMITDVVGFSVVVSTASEQFRILQTRDRTEAERLNSVIAELISRRS